MAGSKHPNADVEKHEAEHIETLSNQRSYVDHRDNDDRADEAKGRNSNKFEKRYWLSVNYLGTLFAIGMAFMGGIGGMLPRSIDSLSCPDADLHLGYGLIAPVLSEINADIGPSPNINWIPLVNLCGGAVLFLMVGQLSDIFGRRWYASKAAFTPDGRDEILILCSRFFIFGSACALLGSFIGAFAKTVNTLIVAQLVRSPRYTKL